MKKIQIPLMMNVKLHEKDTNTIDDECPLGDYNIYVNNLYIWSHITKEFWQSKIHQVVIYMLLAIIITQIPKGF